MSVTSVIINLWIINFTVSIGMLAFAQANILHPTFQPPSMTYYDELTNKLSISGDEVNTGMMFGDFVLGLKLLGEFLIGGNIAWIAQIISGQYWLGLFVKLLYTLSGAFLVIQFVSNRIF